MPLDQEFHVWGFTLDIPAYVHKEASYAHLYISCLLFILAHSRKTSVGMAKKQAELLYIDNVELK